MTLKDLVHQYKRDIQYLEAAASRKWFPVAEIRGMYHQMRKRLCYDLWEVDDWSLYGIRHATRREKKVFTRHVEWVATDFEVALNKHIYHQDIEAGKTYTSHIKPWGILEFNGKKYPVYADDPGQSDYIIVDGEVISAGSYNFHPEEEFISAILANMAAPLYLLIKEN